VLKISRQDGFTITEMLVSSTIMLLIIGGALTTFKNAVQINDAASQLGDSTQNLRAGTNLLIRDLMMAGRIFGAEGVPLPSCAGETPFNRPGPVAGFFNTVSVELDAAGNTITLNLPSISTGYQLGPVIKNSATDTVTIMTVDEFMPVIYHSPPPAPAVTATLAGTIADDGKSVVLPSNSPWLVADTVNDTKPMQVGDLVLFKSSNSSALQTITSMDATHIYFANNTADFFKFNQSCAAPKWPMAAIGNIPTTGSCIVAGVDTCFRTPVSMFRAMMITYYVDNATTPGTPRLTRQVNNFPATALAGVVEDLDLTYDLVDGYLNPTGVTGLPWTDITQTPSVTYNSNQIRKVNVHMGVRSEQISKPTQDYVRNHISTAVDVRSMASVDRYKTTGEVQ
jgi:hypothetical protein